MDIVIIEDEILAAKRLQDIVKKYDPLTRVLAKLDSVKSSIKWFQENAHPNLIFMDIQLGDGMSFEIFEQVLPEAPVIFTTAFDEYAIRAFKVNSIDYLLKPVDFEELSFALNKYKSQVKDKTVKGLMNHDISETVLSMVKKEYKQRFASKVGEHIKTFTINNVACFYSFDKSTFALLINGRNYMLDYSLEQLEHLLDPQQFFRVSRKFIIKHDQIKEIVSYSNSRLKIHLNIPPWEDDIIVSREKVAKFKAWLGY
jgi:DNA-binding LytR/AlgR family response regulator